LRPVHIFVKKVLENIAQQFAYYIL